MNDPEENAGILLRILFFSEILFFRAHQVQQDRLFLTPASPVF